jgi:hypothetical protein
MSVCEDTWTEINPDTENTTEFKTEYDTEDGKMLHFVYIF